MLILSHEREAVVVNQRSELMPRNVREGVSHGQKRILDRNRDSDPRKWTV
jgi:hypothetical protein